MADATQELLLQVRADVNGAVRGLRAVAEQTEETTRSVNRQAGSFSGANSALQGFARGINDSISFQYGFQQGLVATANQADQLVYAFQQMRDAARTTGTTISRQLLTSLTGANGILVAINLVTTAAVILGPRLEEAFDRGRRAARQAQEAFNDALTELIKFESGSRTFTFQNLQQAEAGARAARAEANAIFETYQALQREQEQLLARLRPGGPGGGVVGVTEAQRDRLAELPGLIRQQRDAWNEVARVAAQAQAIARRFAAEARVAGRAGQFGFPLTPEEEAAAPGGRTGGRAGARGRADDRVPLGIRILREEAARADAIMARVNAKLAFLESLRGPTNATATLRDMLDDLVTVEEVTARATYAVDEFRYHLEQLAASGAVQFAYDFGAAFGELVSLQTGVVGFFESIGRAVQRMIADLVAAMATAALLKFVLGPLFGIPGTGGSFGQVLGGVLGFGNAAPAPAPAANVNVTFGAGQFRNGGIWIPAEVQHAAVRYAQANGRTNGWGDG